MSLPLVDGSEIISRRDAISVGRKRYFTGFPCKYGHVAERLVTDYTCLICYSPERRCEIAAAYRAANPDMIVAQNARRDKEMLRRMAKDFYYANQEECRAKARKRSLARYRADPAAGVAEVTLYRARNLDKVNARLRKWSAAKRADDIQFRLAGNLRNRLYCAVRDARAGKRGASAVRNLGCSLAELVTHLERQFSSEMDWENYGAIWHIDHIRPLSAFDLSDDDQAKAVCHYTNLQPLLAAENIRKGGIRSTKA